MLRPVSFWCEAELCLRPGHGLWRKELGADWSQTASPEFLLLNSSIQHPHLKNASIISLAGLWKRLKGNIWQAGSDSYLIFFFLTFFF